MEKNNCLVFAHFSPLVDVFISNRFTISLAKWWNNHDHIKAQSPYAWLHHLTYESFNSMGIKQNNRRIKENWIKTKKIFLEMQNCFTPRCSVLLPMIFFYVILVLKDSIMLWINFPWNSFYYIVLHVFIIAVPIVTNGFATLKNWIELNGTWCANKTFEGSWIFFVRIHALITKPLFK